MRVAGLHDKNFIQVLLDSCNFHNFSDLKMAQKLGCKLEEVIPMIINECGGHTLHPPYVCKGFK